MYLHHRIVCRKLGSLLDRLHLSVLRAALGSQVAIVS